VRAYSFCWQVGDDGVRALLQSCAALRVLRIAGMRGVREMTMMHLTKCSHLHTLVRPWTLSLYVSPSTGTNS
jgi:hypothetical protein